MFQNRAAPRQIVSLKPVHFVRPLQMPILKMPLRQLESQLQPRIVVKVPCASDRYERRVVSSEKYYSGILGDVYGSIFIGNSETGGRHEPRFAVTRYAQPESRARRFSRR